MTIFAGPPRTAKKTEGDLQYAGLHDSWSCYLETLMYFLYGFVTMNVQVQVPKCHATRFWQPLKAGIVVK